MLPVVCQVEQPWGHTSEYELGGVSLTPFTQLINNPISFNLRQMRVVTHQLKNETNKSQGTTQNGHPATLVMVVTTRPAELGDTILVLSTVSKITVKYNNNNPLK